LSIYPSLAMGYLIASSLVRPALGDEVIIDTTSFNSYSLLEASWAYLYPWGSDHNGSARMKANSTDHSHVSLSNGVLSLTATPVTGQPPSTSNPYPAIHYFSGAINSKTHLTVDGVNTKGYQIDGQFIPPLVKGTWPAFWLTGVNSWPPESDIGEWKGDATGWMNTFNTSSAVQTTLVPWPTDGAFHSLRAIIRAVNTKDVSIQYFFDGVSKATHIGANFVNSPLYFIINLQMEGSSGSPGPTGTTVYQIRNVKVTRLTT